MRHDVVIIGAGPSGLAAAARLAHFGVKVCLLEAHGRLGGLSSWHHVKGREISSGLHAFTNYSPDGKGGPLGKLLRQLRIKYSDLKLRPQGQSSIRFPSAILRFSNDTEYVRQQVAERFPGQIDAFDAFRRLIRETDEGELTPRQTSARAVMESYIKEPLLADMLFCPAMFYGNPGGVGDGADADRSRPDMDWLLFCVVWKCVFESGFGHPAGGMRPLWESLAARIREDGGVVRLSARVEKLLAAGGKVRAALLDDGEEIEAELFLSSAGGLETDLLLAPPTDSPPKPAGAISIVEGICLPDVRPVDAGLADTTIFYSFDDAFDFRRPDGLAQAGNGVVCASGNYVSDDGDPGVVKVSQLANYPLWNALDKEAYARAKRGAADGMAEALSRLGAGKLKEADRGGKYGLFDDVFTPVTLRRYTGHAEGALYGSPVKSRTGATACENLFLIGADQGFHGIVGAMLSGVAMANMHWLSVN